MRAHLEEAAIVLAVLADEDCVHRRIPGTHNAIGFMSGSVLESGILFWLVRIARDQGKKIQEQLYANWGGKPTTAMLRHSDQRIDPFTKDRYKRALSKFSGLAFPNEKEEKAEPLHSDQLYESAVRALIEVRRGRAYPLIFSENCNFGFIRNLLGLRPTGLCVAVMSLMVVGTAIWKRHGAVPQTWWIPIGVSAVVILFLLFFVTTSAAKRSGEAYADALLRSCEKSATRKPASAA